MTYYLLLGFGIWLGASARMITGFKGVPLWRLLLAFAAMIVLWPIGLVLIVMDEIYNGKEQS